LLLEWPQSWLRIGVGSVFYFACVCVKPFTYLRAESFEYAAGAAVAGTLPPPLGVFENGISDSGYLPSSIGIPVADWYNRSGQPPTLQVLQTDFVWGFLAANSTKPPSAAIAALRARLPSRSTFFSVRERTQGN
jgi:hypothetical protein